MKAAKEKSCTCESDQTDQYIWHSPLLQAVATLRASGQMFCADACQELFTLLHTLNPNERSEVEIVKQLIDGAKGYVIYSDDLTDAGPSHYRDTLNSYICAYWSALRSNINSYADAPANVHADAGGAGGGARSGEDNDGEEADLCHEVTAQCAETITRSSGSPVGTCTRKSCAITAGCGSQRRHCSQAAPLGGGIRSDPFDGSSEQGQPTGQMLRCYDSYWRSILLPM